MSISALTFIRQISGKSDAITRTAFFLLLVMAGFAAWQLADGATLEQRVVYIRYTCFVFAGVLAFLIPHLLYPENRLSWIQQLNPPKSYLFAAQMLKLLGLPLVFTLMILILGFYDPAAPLDHIEQKSAFVVQGVLFLFGLTLYGAFRFFIIGRRSQQWQEGIRGAGLMDGMKQVGQAPATPPGMFPSFGATVAISGGGMMLVVAQAWLTAYEPAFLAWLPYILLVLWAAHKIYSERGVMDQHFYQTQAFYSELFINPGAHGAEQREPVSFDAVYWVPKVWRAPVWAGVLQLDRRLPFGRIMVLMVLFLWFLFYTGMNPEIIIAWLLVMITGKNALIYLLTAENIGPLPFQLTLHSPAQWMRARFFINLRWTLPLFLGLFFPVWISTQYDWSFLLTWMLVDLFAAALSAWLVTGLHEMKFKKQYA